MTYIQQLAVTGGIVGYMKSKADAGKPMIAGNVRPASPSREQTKEEQASAGPVPSPCFDPDDPAQQAELLQREADQPPNVATFTQSGEAVGEKPHTAEVTDNTNCEDTMPLGTAGATSDGDSSETISVPGWDDGEIQQSLDNVELAVVEDADFAEPAKADAANPVVAGKVRFASPSREQDGEEQALAGPALSPRLDPDNSAQQADLERLRRYRTESCEEYEAQRRAKQEAEAERKRLEIQALCKSNQEVEATEIHSEMAQIADVAGEAEAESVASSRLESEETQSPCSRPPPILEDPDQQPAIVLNGPALVDRRSTRSSIHSSSMLGRSFPGTSSIRSSQGSRRSSLLFSKRSGPALALGTVLKRVSTLRQSRLARRSRLHQRKLRSQTEGHSPLDAEERKRVYSSKLKDGVAVCTYNEFRTLFADDLTMEDIDRLWQQKTQVLRVEPNLRVSKRASRVTPPTHQGQIPALSLRRPQKLEVNTSFSCGSESGDDSDSEKDTDEDGGSAASSRAVATLKKNKGVPETYVKLMEQSEQLGWDNVKWNNGYSLLHWAAKNNLAELCGRMMAQGADPFQKDSHGKDSYDYALEFNSRAALAQLHAGAPRLVPKVMSTPISRSQRRSSQEVKFQTQDSNDRSALSESSDELEIDLTEEKDIPLDDTWRLRASTAPQ